MNVFVTVLLALFGAYMVFAFLPSVVMFFVVFGRKKGKGTESIPGSYLEPYAEEIKSAYGFFDALTPEELTLKARDGVTLYARYYGTGSGRAAILVHGYGATPMLNFAVMGRDLYNAGFSLLMIEQRAHCRSGGAHCCFGLVEKYDIADWIKLIEDRGEKELLLYGISMGSAAAAYASEIVRDGRIKAMVLDCGIRSAYDQLRLDGMNRHVPWQIILPHLVLLTRIFLKADIKKTVKSALEKARIPVFFLHGEADGTVPCEYTIEHAEACPTTAEVLTVPGADHTTAYYAEGSQARERLRKFLEERFG